jgi:hypothetical protein
MEANMMMIIVGFALALVLNLPIYMHYRHKRKLAEARLEIAKVVTEMDELMLSGETLQVGDLCHDKIYQWMLSANYCERFRAKWQFWKRPSAELVEMRDRIASEIDRETEVGKLLTRYVMAQYRAFVYNRPVASICFRLWLLTLAGGIVILLAGMFSILKIMQTWERFNRYRAETYVAACASA